MGRKLAKYEYNLTDYSYSLKDIFSRIIYYSLSYSLATEKPYLIPWKISYRIFDEEFIISVELTSRIYSANLITDYLGYSSKKSSATCEEIFGHISPF